MSIHTLRVLLKYFSRSGINGRVLMQTTLLGFYSLLRKSNLFSSNCMHEDNHVILGQDIQTTTSALYVHVRSHKMSQGQGNDYTAQMPCMPRLGIVYILRGGSTGSVLRYTRTAQLCS